MLTTPNEAVQLNELTSRLLIDCYDRVLFSVWDIKLQTPWANHSVPALPCSICEARIANSFVHSFIHSENSLFLLYGWRNKIYIQYRWWMRLVTLITTYGQKSAAENHVAGTAGKYHYVREGKGFHWDQLSFWLIISLICLGRIWINRWEGSQGQSRGSLAGADGIRCGVVGDETGEITWVPISFFFKATGSHWMLRVILGRKTGLKMVPYLLQRTLVNFPGMVLTWWVGYEGHSHIWLIWGVGGGGRKGVNY